MKTKKLEDFKPVYNCRFHPTDGWHEVGCNHKSWKKEELLNSLDNVKQSNAYLIYLLEQEIKRKNEN
jgi:hypothetical protein